MLNSSRLRWWALSAFSAACSWRLRRARTAIAAAPSSRRSRPAGEALGDALDAFNRSFAHAPHADERVALPAPALQS
jgi:hypothetical protein